MTVLASLFFILAIISGLAATVCSIMVIVQMFKRAGAGMGIVGIITCGWGAFIWGWIKAKEYDLKKLMLIYTASIGVMLLAYAGMAIFGLAAAATNPDVQEAFKKAQEEAAAQRQPQ